MEGQNEDLKDKNAQLQTQYEQLKSTHEMAVRETAELRDQFHQQETAMDDLQAAAAAAVAGLSSIWLSQPCRT